MSDGNFVGAAVPRLFRVPPNLSRHSRSYNSGYVVAWEREKGFNLSLLSPQSF